MKTNLVRIILRVTPEEGQSFSDAALKDDRELHHWILRTLRNASGRVSTPSSVSQVAVKPAPVVAPPRPAPALWVSPAVPGSPCAKMYSPPASTEKESSYDCAPKQTMDDYIAERDKNTASAAKTGGLSPSEAKIAAARAAYDATEPGSAARDAASDAIVKAMEDAGYCMDVGN